MRPASAALFAAGASGSLLISALELHLKPSAEERSGGGPDVAEARECKDAGSPVASALAVEALFAWTWLPGRCLTPLGDQGEERRVGGAAGPGERSGNSWVSARSLRLAPGAGPSWSSSSSPGAPRQQPNAGR
jgi:hypothetical protein